MLYRLIPGKTLLLTVVVILLHGAPIAAQCNRTGWVASVTPGCGAVIKELTTGQFFRAVAGTETLVGGKTIRFSSIPGIAPLTCPQDGLPSIMLTCVSDSLLTEAHFSYAASQDNPLTYTFQAELVDGATQSCEWSFGDGPVLGLTGSVVQYTFQQPGLHNVCLQIKDNSGLLAQSCQEVLVSGQPASPCGYDTYITAVGTDLYAKLLPQNSTAGQLALVTWTIGKNGIYLGNTPSLTTQLPDYGAYLICAEFTAKDTGLLPICAATICKALNVTEPGCENPQLMSTVQVCPNDEVPVCGCDGLSYSNECEALAAGVTTWWAGDCNTIYGSCVADLEMRIISGSPDIGYTVRFNNLSGGDFSNCHLDFGDGSPIWEATQWDSIIYHYAKGGVYRVSLSAWKQNACASTVTKLLVTDA
ncbi:MAG: PKD domain-containing protein, partial [Saprospiraceae bacterium]